MSLPEGIKLIGSRYAVGFSSGGKNVFAGYFKALPEAVKALKLAKAIDYEEKGMLEEAKLAFKEEMI